MLPKLSAFSKPCHCLRRAGIADASADLVISNCVVNLSPDKPRVIREAYRALRPGGEMHFSDVYADRRVPAALQKDEVIFCALCHSESLHVLVQIVWEAYIALYPRGELHFSDKYADRRCRQPSRRMR